MPNLIIDKISTTAGPLHITQVGSEDLNRVMALLNEASHWLISRGITQWRWILTDAGRAVIATRFETDEMYLVYQGDDPVATFSLRWQESTMWGGAGNDGQAGYLYGFAVARKLAGQGVGLELIAWAAGQVAARGKRFLRLDTDAGNAGICDYYQRAGFHACGEAPRAQGGMLQLYEREIDERSWGHDAK